jgi:DNA-binding PadR family transcriptional regulator
MPAGRAPTPNEWVVLALVAERSSHGWALASQLAPGGGLGRVRALSRPVVYHGLDRLEHEGRIRAARIERGGRGPHRVIYEATPRGRKELLAWLAAPVERVRELRPLFLLKVVLSERLAVEAEPLLVAQRALLLPLAGLFEAQLDEADPDPAAERRLLASSLETVCSTLRLIDGLLDALPGPDPAPRAAPRGGAARPAAPTSSRSSGSGARSGRGAR